MSNSPRDSSDRVLKIAESYKEEADKCVKVKAYHASSIFLASAIEGLILAMYYCNDSRARKTTTYRCWRKQGKSIWDWDFFKLISLAKELEWIQGRVRIGQSTVALSEAVDRMRKLRNTIHAGNYYRTRRGELVSAKDFQYTTTIFQAIVEALEAAL